MKISRALPVPCFDYLFVNCVGPGKIVSLDGNPLMQRFALIHDGSDQGWQTAYLAFHVSAQLGAPLQVLLGASTNKATLVQRAAQVEIGGRAARVVIGTRLVADFSLDTLLENTNSMDGLFIPRRLLPDGETAVRFLEALSCPLWIVSRGPEIHKMAVLATDLVVDEKLIHYTSTLSHRLQQSLTGFIQAEKLALMFQNDLELDWESIPNFSSDEISSTVDQLDVDLLFVPASKASLIDNLTSNCVIFPAM